MKKAIPITTQRAKATIKLVERGLNDWIGIVEIGKATHTTGRSFVFPSAALKSANDWLDANRANVAAQA